MRVMRLPLVLLCLPLTACLVDRFQLGPAVEGTDWFATSIAGTDLEEIKRNTENLATASQTASQKLYEAAAAKSAAGGDSGQGPSAGSSAGNDDEIIDAEIVDEK